MASNSSPLRADEDNAITRCDSPADERQPLLNSADTSKGQPEENPLPVKQIAALAYARLSEPVRNPIMYFPIVLWRY
jgi:hypothetical protein